MIQWFPGHMAKARNEIEKNISLVDVVIELVDARTPKASQNPMLQEILEQKPKIVLLMKSDLADHTITKQWIEHFEAQSIRALPMNVNDRRHITHLIDAVNDVGAEELAKRREKGIQHKTIRALITGIPNVGKSTLINRLANRNIAKTGDRPAMTRHQQWIKVRGKFDLLDTPGILWPKFEDDHVGQRLAMIGTIKYDLIPAQDITAHLLQHIGAHYPTALEERYDVSYTDDMWELFEQIGRKRGALESGGRVNFDKVAEIVLLDFRLGRLGNISLESPNENEGSY